MTPFNIQSRTVTQITEFYSWDIKTISQCFIFWTWYRLVGDITDADSRETRAKNNNVIKRDNKLIASYNSDKGYKQIG